MNLKKQTVNTHDFYVVLTPMLDVMFILLIFYYYGQLFNRIRARAE